MFSHELAHLIPRVWKGACSIGFIGTNVIRLSFLVRALRGSLIRGHQIDDVSERHAADPADIVYFTRIAVLDKIKNRFGDVQGMHEVQARLVVNPERFSMEQIENGSLPKAIAHHLCQSEDLPALALADHEEFGQTLVEGVRTKFRKLDRCVLACRGKLTGIVVDIDSRNQNVVGELEVKD